MSPDESDNSTTATAVAAPAAPVTGSTDGDQPAPSDAAPVASATPAATDTTIATEPNVEPVKPEEKPAEETKEEAKDEAKDDNAVDTKEAKDDAEKKANTDRDPARTPPPRNDYQQSSQYNYPPPAPQSFLNVPQDLPYPFFLHNNFLMIFIFLGMLFILIGGILSGSAIIAKNYDIYGGSIIAISIGLFTVSTFLTLAGLFRKDLNQFIRLGFLIIGGFAIFGIVVYSRFGAM